jgi:ubiquinone/menaquinone biosynthesis C-methylase UbiE
MGTGEMTFSQFETERREHWDQVARIPENARTGGRYYHKRLNQVMKGLVAPGQRILEVGCGAGDLLAALDPACGVGLDFSPEMLRKAQSRHSGLHFVQMDAHSLGISSERKFDVIILSDLLNDLWDVQRVLEEVSRLSHRRTRLIINTYSKLWEPVLKLAGSLKLSRPNLLQNWLTVDDVANLLYLSEFEVIRHWGEVLWPFATPLWADFCNKVLARIWPLTHLALTNVIIARPEPGARPRLEEPSVSIIIPARNEAGNIPRIFERTPALGRETELIFVEGHSRDETYAAIEECIRRYPDRKALLMKQEGEGKGDAVRKGFAHASGDLLMILDADMTVPPEDLQRFYEAWTSGKGDFVNGVRLIYPMEDQAMQFLNVIGNKLFVLGFSWLIGQPIKDTLCGTKVLSKADYDLIAANRAQFGDFDPFGDFDLIFGAAKQVMRIVDVPIRYRERVYGSTNIHRWRHGLLLLRMFWIGAWKLKFI